MSDQEALQEAIQRARQLAAKISQASVKRPASGSDHSIGTVKVTHAYEKPPDNNNRSSASNLQQPPQPPAPSSGSSSHSRDDSNNRGGGGERGDRQDRGGDRGDRIGGSAGGKSYGGGGGSNSMLGGHNNYSPAATGIANEDRIELIIPHAVIGLVIGKGGENIKRIQNETGATVRVDPNTVDEKGNKVCTITGTKRAVDEAHSQVSNVIENAATNKRPRMQVDGSDQYRMKIPASRTGAIIGKGGETIKSIKQQSGCDIELDKNAKECGPDESVFIIRGTQDKILKARAMIEARLASRGRDGDNSGRSNHSSSKGVATGANAAPVAQFTDLPTSYPAAGQNSADMSVAWAAYFAQYSNLFNQAGSQPGATNLPYAGTNLLGTAATQQPDQPLQSQPPQQPQQVQPAAQAGQPAADYSDQWIEFYMMNGRPDYAEQIIEMRKQQQHQTQKQQAP